MIGVYYILGLVQLFAALAIVTACDPVHWIRLLAWVGYVELVIIISGIVSVYIV